LEEEFRDAVEDGNREFLTKEEFETYADLPNFLKKRKLEFYNFYEPYILVAYDTKKDIHYFFTKR
jgi:hypothetical protein